jgi:hypothetical protein
VSLVDTPVGYLAFASLHLVIGQGGASVVHRLRFGADPLVLYTTAGNRHQRLSRGVAAASVGWALAPLCRGGSGGRSRSRRW